MSTLDKNQWAIDLLAALGNKLQPKQELIDFVHAWEEMESGASDDSPASYNPLNTTFPMPNSTDFNTAHVQNYTSYQQGIQATMATLSDGLYPTILGALKGNDAGLLTNVPFISGDLTVWVSGQRSPIDESYVSGILQIVVQEEGTPLPMSNQPWFLYPVVVPFGNPNYDSGLGGSHDMDVQPPPNTPVTALLPGTVVDLSAPSWGKQVGLLLDQPYNGIPYMGYLHLSAINPGLKLGGHVSVGALIGWVGGAIRATDYNGTTNPTGQNFLNAPAMSSQIQVGIALMRGPVYGSGAGWETFPPIDFSLDPTPVLKAAIAAWTPPAPLPDNANQRKAFEIEWASEVPDVMLNSGIALAAWADYQNNKFHGPATSLEYADVDWNGNTVVAQNTHSGTYHWVNNGATFFSYH